MKRVLIYPQSLPGFTVWFGSEPVSERRERLPLVERWEQHFYVTVVKPTVADGDMTAPTSPPL